MQPAGEAGELGAAVLALAVGRVAIENGRRRGAAMRALIAQIDPLPAGLGPARTRSEHRHRRIVGMDHAAGHHVAGDQLTEGPEQPGDVAEPFGKLAAIDIDTAASIDLSLPVERKMVAELGGGDVREEARSGHAAQDRQVGRRRLHHRLALAARDGRPDVAGDLEAAGDVLQHLGHALTDPAQLAAAAGFACIGRRMHDVAARQLRWQLAPFLLVGRC